MKIPFPKKLLPLAALPPAEAVAVFQAMGYRIDWDWRDAWRDARSHALAYAEAAATAEDPVAAETAALSGAAGPAWEETLAAIAREVGRAPDLATLQRRLTDLYGGLDTGDLVNVMAAAFALAELKGMVDARG